MRNRLEAKYVECQPRVILIDRILNQTRPSYRIDKIFFKQAKLKSRSADRFTNIDSQWRWANSNLYHIYLTTSNADILKPQHHNYESLFVAEDKVRSLNNFVRGVKKNSTLTFYTDLPNRYLLFYVLLIAFLWIIFVLYLYQLIRRFIFVSRS